VKNSQLGGKNGVTIGIRKELTSKQVVGKVGKTTQKRGELPQEKNREEKRGCGECEVQFGTFVELAGKSRPGVASRGRGNYQSRIARHSRERPCAGRVKSF